jgi:hypothetical protein
MRYILFAILLLLPSTALARKDSGSNLQVRLNGAIAAGTTLAASRSITFSGDELSGIGLVVIYAEITDANNGEVGVSMACTAEPRSGGQPYRIPTCVWDSANLRHNCEAGPLFWNPSDETSPKRQVFRADVEGISNATCTFTFTTGSSDDAIKAVADGAVK